MMSKQRWNRAHFARLTQPFRRSAIATGRFLWELFRSPQSALGTLIVLFFLMLAIFGARIAPYDENDPYDADGNLLPAREEPTASLGAIIDTVRDNPAAAFKAETYALGDYPFGTDSQRRDIYSRVILGTESIFRVAGVGTLIAVVIGTSIGLFAGYQGGMVDEVASRTIDAMLAMPALLIALVILGVVHNIELESCRWETAWHDHSWSVFEKTAQDLNFGLGLAGFSGVPMSKSLSWRLAEQWCLLRTQLADNSVLLVITLVYVPIVARVVRSSTLQIKTREFIQAAQIRGESRFYIIFREIFPSVIPILVVEASLRFSYAIFLVASLGFLGVGVLPPTPDWGRMVSDARKFYDAGPVSAPWMLEYPAAAIAILVVGVNLMSDGIKRAVQKSG